jgi:putative heme degradation protein
MSGDGFLSSWGASAKGGNTASQEGERNKGENHQDNWTKTTSLIPKFTQ